MGADRTGPQPAAVTGGNLVLALIAAVRDYQVLVAGRGLWPHRCGPGLLTRPARLRQLDPMVGTVECGEGCAEMFLSVVNAVPMGGWS